MAELTNETEVIAFGQPLPVADMRDMDRALSGWQVRATAEQLSAFRCTGCGYGASCRMAPERCPMCGGGTWEYDERRRLRDIDQPLRREGML
jgi:rubrerythrin